MRAHGHVDCGGWLAEVELDTRLNTPVLGSSSTLSNGIVGRRTIYIGIALSFDYHDQQEYSIERRNRYSIQVLDIYLITLCSLLCIIRTVEINDNARMEYSRSIVYILGWKVITQMGKRTGHIMVVVDSGTT